jgi:hypothetical protein
MGMFDTIEDEQIKVFYVPIFSNKYIKEGQEQTWHSGGRLKHYGPDDDLPLTTWYYKYPENFMIFDYRYECVMVIIIKDGKYCCIKNYPDLTEQDLQGAVYDYYGEKLEIKTMQDFHDIKDHDAQLDKDLEALHKRYFINGIFDAMQNNKEYYESVKDEHNKERDVLLKAFTDRWYSVDPYQNEKQLGEYLECLFYLALRKDDEPKEWDHPKEKYEACKKAIRDFIAKYPDIVERYINWVSCLDEELTTIRLLIGSAKDDR